MVCMAINQNKVIYKTIIAYSSPYFIQHLKGVGRGLFRGLRVVEFMKGQERNINFWSPYFPSLTNPLGESEIHRFNVINVILA